MIRNGFFGGGGDSSSPPKHKNSLSDLNSMIIAAADVIASMISAANADRNGFMDFDEFERVLDADHDSKISLSDLKSMIIADDDVIASMISAVDRNGFMDFDEFERVLGGGGGRDRREVMEDAFRVMDRDGDDCYLMRWLLRCCVQ